MHGVQVMEAEPIVRRGGGDGDGVVKAVAEVQHSESLPLVSAPVETGWSSMPWLSDELTMRTVIWTLAILGSVG